MSSKKISFSVPEYLYDGIKDFLKSRTWFCSDIRVEDYFKACAINRMIDIGVLDDFGMPIPFFEPNSLKLPTWDELNKTFTTSTFSMNDLRSITSDIKKE